MIKKSYLYILITFFMMIACCGRVSAFSVMYKECPSLIYCPGDLESCYDAYNTVVNSNGNGLFFEYDKAMQLFNYNDFDYNNQMSVVFAPAIAQGQSMCWIDHKEDFYKSCKYGDSLWMKDNAYEYSVLKGECPVIIRGVHDFAGSGSEEADDLKKIYNFSTGEFLEYSKDLYASNSFNKDLIIPVEYTSATKDSVIWYPEWVIYSYKYQNDKILVVEGYLDDGRRFYINLNYDFMYYDSFFDKMRGDGSVNTYPELQPNANNSSIIEDVYIYKSVYLNKGKFWKLYSSFDKTSNYYISGICKEADGCDLEIIVGAGEVTLESENVFKYVYSDSYIDKALEEWAGSQDVDGVSSRNNKLIQYVNYINDSKYEKIRNDFIQTFKEESVYYFNSDYSEHQFLADLEQTYELLLLVAAEKENGYLYKNHWTNESAKMITTDARSYVLQYLFGDFKTSTIDNDSYFLDDIITMPVSSGFASSLTGENTTTAEFENIFMSYIEEKAVQYIDKIANLDGFTAYIKDDDQFREDVRNFTNAIAYFDYYSLHTELSDEERNRLNELNDKMQVFAKKYNIYPDSLTCSDLIGDELEEKILSYFNIIRIVVPMLLIGLGVFDFTKAIFAGDESAMKKAQSKFIKRIFIAILFFFVPMIVKLILEIAGRVWVIISPDTCINF